MTNAEFEIKLNSYVSLINQSLDDYIESVNQPYRNLVDAMKYSLMAGGKRIRPVLLLEFNRICGGDYNTAIPFACAMEMIHTFSLIHDDLPCMDNDTLRRGKPTCHVKFNEPIALLAGDGLLSYAFEVMASVLAKKTNISAENALKAILEMATSTGYKGMIGGQTIDIDQQKNLASIAQLKEMQSLKTGAIIEASCKVGCILAGASDEQVAKAHEYAQCLGLAFQIKDDLLDITSSSQEMGKTIGKDVAQDKITFPSLIGIDESIKMIEQLTSQAILAVSAFEDSAFLKILAEKLRQRKN